MSFNVSFEHIYAWKNHWCDLSIKLWEPLDLGFINDVFKCYSNIITPFSLLLNREYKLILNKLALQLWRNVFGK